VLIAGCSTTFAAAGLAASFAAAGPFNIEVHARALRPGELVVLTITPPPDTNTVHVRAFARDAPVFRLDDRTWRALVGIDLDAATGPHEIVVRASPGGARASEVLNVQPHEFPTRRLTVDASFVNPPPAVQSRIAAEARTLAALWLRSSPAPLWNSAFVRPVPQDATSSFGLRSVFNGQPRAPHAGADFPAPTGTPIHAPAAGRIVLARDLYFTGNTVVIDHGLGLFSLLAHMSQIDVHEGATVAADEIVGLVGATGRVTGAHLHWAVRVNDARVDPLSVISALADR
jgi:murein DD-endopeptidase MepM/ murein hydrolase activator NlpD